MTARRCLFGLLFLVAAWFTPYQAEQARATTMTATVTCFAGPCINDAGIRSNLVGVLGFNRFAVLPFLFNDANATLTGTAVVADFLIGRSNFFYLYANGVGVQNSIGGFFLSSAITQSYATLAGIDTFSAFNVGSCNVAGILNGDGAIMTPFVNRVALGGGRGTTACSPFAQFYGPNGRFIGNLTNLTATDVMRFNAGGGAVITLPWGSDFPNSNFPTLNNDLNGDSASAIISDLQSLGLTQQTAPEPATLAVLGSGLVGLTFLRRKQRS